LKRVAIGGVSWPIRVRKKKLHRHTGVQQTFEAPAGKLILSQHSSIGYCLHERYIPGATFPLAMVLMAVLLMLRAATSLRAAATAIEISEQVYRNRLLAGPTHNTVRNYLLRLGLYELTRAKAVLGDWIWIVDHTIQVGNQLCLVVLGIALSHFQRLGRPLQCQDMQVLELLPMEKSNGQIMAQHFAALADRYGQPVAIVSDEGSDIHGGFSAFGQDRPGPVRCRDIVHKMSRLIKRILDRCVKWSAYRTACCASGNRLRQSSLAHLCPPKPKTKARHMNLSPEIQWGVSMLELLDGIEANKNYDAQQRQRLGELAGWLKDYRQELAAWAELMLLSEVTCEVVRRAGYRDSIVDQVKQSLPPVQSAIAGELIENTLEFLQVQQSACVPSLGPLPGSSEVIESLFGKGKRLEGQQSRSGFTAQLLSMAACVCEPTEELITEAFESVGIKHVEQWQASMLGPSVQSRRRRDLGRASQKAAQATTSKNPKV